MRKSHTPEFKAKLVVETLREEKTINQIASENAIHPTMLSRWRAEAIDRLPSVFRGETDSVEKLKLAHENQLQELYEQIGRLSVDLEWLKKKSARWADTKATAVISR